MKKSMLQYEYGYSKRKRSTGKDTFTNNTVFAMIGAIIGGGIIVAKRWWDKKKEAK